ncbi:VanZ family protein [Bacillus sp. CGMCC 1.16607]|uniref:VanZ family protein n=1 Tax=Bacillus sp. CGMCC 1.16607 TaxID=3351842 RepID=UPI0036330C1D
MSNGRKSKALLLWIAVLLEMMLIFSLSAQPVSQSNKLSKGVTKTVVETVEKVSLGMDLSTDRLNHIVRKNAHFFTYLILACFIWMALKKSGMNKYKAFSWALLVCVLYAITDEIHQLFVPGRGSQVKDVLIDSAGAVTGLGLCSVASQIRRKMKKS